MELRPDDRQCAVARLEAYCWKDNLARPQSPERREALAVALHQVKSFVLYACLNTRVPKPKVDNVFNAVKQAWEITAMQRARDTPRRRRP